MVFREGDRPLVGLFGLMRATDLPEWFRDRTWTEPELIIRARDGHLIASYTHVHFLAQPNLAARFVLAANQHSLRSTVP